MIANEFISAVVNHLWQSTVVVGAAWVLAFALRKNQARVRYWVWMAASLKFLLPFSLLMAAGEWLRSFMPTHVVARPAVADAMEQMAQPFAGAQFFDATQTVAVTRHGFLFALVVNWRLAALMAVWTCGVVVVAGRFRRGWRKVDAAKRAARRVGVVGGFGPSFEIAVPSLESPGWNSSGRTGRGRLWACIPRVPFRLSGLRPGLFSAAPPERKALRASFDVEAGVPMLVSASLMEPGVFGIFRPVLLLPQGILERLPAEQLRAIVAHEMCHVRRRDNLTFALHMIVETLFWFHPAVWWIGARLIEERERACDEAVVQAGGAAQTYAAGILNVCKFYVESPVECVAGVTGADLKVRVARIMTGRGAFRLTWREKALLAVAVLMAAMAPVVLGLGQNAVDEANWEKAAGGMQEFDVASVRQDAGEGQSYSNFSLDNGNAYFTLGKNDAMAPNGTLFSAKYQTLMRYIIFAYKLSGTQELALRFDYYKGLELHTPDWVKGDRYDIEARTAQPATKDQMRLMMQSLLAERFKLHVHWETRQAPVFALVEATPGKLGPQLREDPASDDCNATAFPEDSGKGAAGTQPGAQSLATLPIPCGVIAHLPASDPGAHRFGGRDVPLTMLATSLPAQTGMATLPRPVVDKTGLAGGYDFWMQWTPEDTSEVNNSESGGTFREALKNQLGLKLEAANGPVEVLVIDHVERPGEN